MRNIKIINCTMIVLVCVFSYPLNSSQMDDQVLAENKQHHTKIGFQNHPHVETAAPKGILFYMRRFWASVFVPNIPDGHALSELESMQLLNSIDGDRITWLGHASFLLKTSEVTILTDPFLTEFASPISWAGPRRFVNSGIPIDRLESIDILIISHNHYDHLDEKTISNLKNKETIHVVVPLGLKSFFIERGYSKVTELDWGESVSVGNVELTSHPAVHDSARSTDDHNKTLWASWVIQSPKKRIIFVGDTGYSDTIYNEIGEKYNSFDFAILPIGAYEPRKLMWMSHVTPEEAVSIGNDVHANTLIASHWGAVSSLSDEPPFEPPNRFRVAGTSSGFSERALWVMKVGETRSLSRN